MASCSNLTVNVSGCVWSSLFLDHASSMGDQEGFLFGEIRRQTNEDISDSQITRKTEQISVNIFSHYACDEPFSFYDRKGHTDQVKLLSMLKDNYKHTIGWYRFRRNTLLEPSMRESTLHRELLKLFHVDTPDLFLLGLFTSGMAWNQATHFFNHQLLTLGDRGLTPLGVNIINLGDTSHSEYRETVSAGTVATVTGTYSGILNNFRDRTADSLNGVRVIREISDTVYSKMQTLKNKLGASEKMLQAEIEQVRELQREKKEP
ncbi:BRISC complex subunit Abraxas 2-like [Acanthaster planci]|uniref:BRISC complex subunit Abraxas 2-like n=1 Tax=Acanthaster planci TaxID=133434 RepID=A0A8B7Y3S1_ACAPL|nr:BRISC complex subunit Abraxas 2-like [Acanthaster planci]